VNYDSAVSNPNFHVRGEYANVQTRINGLVLPEGVSGLGPVIDTNFIGSLSLLTGTLPAQYGLRTAGVLDITSRAFSTPGGSVSLYGGSHGTIPSTSSRGAATGAISESKTRPRRSMRSTITPIRASSSPTCRPQSTTRSG
jgi:hypothetical protein